MAYKLKGEKITEKCQFCNLSDCDTFSYGQLYKVEDVVAHYYCVILSSNLRQNGKDNEGILGFLLPDIKAELKRSKTRKCCYCKRKNATIICSNSKCKTTFHLPCGRKHYSLHQFMGEFKSFCCKHRPTQNIPAEILRKAEQSKVKCPICYEGFPYKPEINTRIWASCCNNAWYHWECIQLLAYSAGYFFKCPMCNNKKEFRIIVQQLGIFVPQRDASWELEPNAFEDLLFRYNKCDASICICPFGREQTKEKLGWKVILCQLCGSQGIHRRCGNLPRYNSKWECSLCSKAIQSNQSNSNNRESGGSSLKLVTKSALESMDKRKRAFASEDEEHAQHTKKKSKNSTNEEEEKLHATGDADDKGNESEESEDIDVVTVETNKSHERSTLLEALLKLKPGPLSYKLNFVKSILGNLVSETQVREENQVSSDYKTEDSELNCIRSEPEVIYLSDSEDEEENEKGANEENSDIEIIEEYKKVATSQCCNVSDNKAEKNNENNKNNEVAKAHPSSVAYNRVPKSQNEASCSGISLAVKYQRASRENFNVVSDVNLVHTKNDYPTHKVVWNFS